MEQIAKALIEFQNSCPPIPKDSEVTVKTNNGGSYKFKYADFGTIVKSIKGPLYQHKLCYRFLVERITADKPDNVFICRVIHESGKHFDTGIPMPALSDRMQERGSQLTYLKRYALVLALGLDTDADEDGNIADGNEIQKYDKAGEYQQEMPVTESYGPYGSYLPPMSKAPPKAETNQPSKHEKEAMTVTKSTKKVTPAQVNRLYKIQESVGWSKQDLNSYVRRDYGCDVQDLNMKQYDEVCTYVNASGGKNG